MRTWPVYKPDIHGHVDEGGGTGSGHVAHQERAKAPLRIMYAMKLTMPSQPTSGSPQNYMAQSQGGGVQASRKMVVVGKAHPREPAVMMCKGG